MSYSNAYVPPPPAEPRKGRSPWLYVGLGCLALVVLTFGGCAILLTTAVNRVKTAMNQPLNKTEVMASLQQIPLYPNAQLDVNGTKILRTTFSMVPTGGLKASAGMFSTPDAPEKVEAWYGQKLIAVGWKDSPQGSTSFGMGSRTGPREQKAYIKGKDQLVMQYNNPKSGKGSSFSLILMSSPRPR